MAALEIVGLTPLDIPEDEITSKKDLEIKSAYEWEIAAYIRRCPSTRNSESPTPKLKAVRAIPPLESCEFCQLNCSSTKRAPDWRTGSPCCLIT
jgi:hypothetical protein